MVNPEEQFYLVPNVPTPTYRLRYMGAETEQQELASFLSVLTNFTSLQIPVRIFNGKLRVSATQRLSHVGCGVVRGLVVT